MAPSFHEGSYGLLMPRQLKNLVINEVSSVDRGAGRGVQVMLMKRDGGTIEKRPPALLLADALELTLKSIFEDAAITDKDAAVAKAFRDFQDHLDGHPLVKSEHNAMPTLKEIQKALADGVAEAITKLSAPHKESYEKITDAVAKTDFLAMTDPERDAYIAKTFPPKKKPGEKEDDTEAAKRAAEEITKRDAEIAKRDALLAKQNTQIDTLQKSVDALVEKDLKVSLSKRAVELGLPAVEGADLLLKAERGDLASIKKLEDHAAALVVQAQKGGVFAEFGGQTQVGGTSPHDQLVAKAGEIRKAKPELTEEQAYTKALEDPANRDIVRAEKRERDARIFKLAS